MAVEEKPFKTTDLALATFLVVSGLELIDSSPVAKYNKDKVTFIFNDVKRAKKLKAAYFSKRATVDPLTFMNQLRSLKAMVKSN